MTLYESLVQLSNLEIIFHRKAAALFVGRTESISHILKVAMLEAPGSAISSADRLIPLSTLLRPGNLMWSSTVDVFIQIWNVRHSQITNWSSKQ